MFVRNLKILNKNPGYRSLYHVSMHKRAVLFLRIYWILVACFRKRITALRASATEIVFIEYIRENKSSEPLFRWYCIRHSDDRKVYQKIAIWCQLSKS